MSIENRLRFLEKQVADVAARVDGPDKVHLLMARNALGQLRRTDEMRVELAEARNALLSSAGASDLGSLCADIRSGAAAAPNVRLALEHYCDFRAHIRARVGPPFDAERPDPRVSEGKHKEGAGR